MKALIEGVVRYERNARPRYGERFAALAGGQKPHTLFLTCVDSRVVPTLVSSAEPGELFVVRNVANLVPRAAKGRVEHADTSVSAAVWYALEVLELRDVVVCGHSSCGGVSALLQQEPPQSPELRQWLSTANPSLELWRRLGPLDPAYAPEDQLSQLVTRHQLDNLRSYPFVRSRVERGDVRLHAWWFEIQTGRVLAYSEKDACYVPVVDVHGDLSALARQDVA